MVQRFGRGLEAWVMLTTLQLVLAVGRFDRVKRLLSSVRPLRGASPARREEDVQNVLLAIQRAQRWTIGPVRCLHTASTCTLMLRLRGLPAEVVIGVRGAPFEAHAWTELFGKVIGDRELVTRSYAPVHRA